MFIKTFKQEDQMTGTNDQINSSWRIIAFGEGVMVREEIFHDKGTVVPLHNHYHEQITYVTSGRLQIITGEGEGPILGPEDAIYFGPNEKHGVVTLEPETTLCDSFSPMRMDHLENRPVYNK